MYHCNSGFAIFLQVTLNHFNNYHVFLYRKMSCLPVILYCSIWWMYNTFIMFTCYCTAGYECTEYILCLLVIVPQFINVQIIYIMVLVIVLLYKRKMNKSNKTYNLQKLLFNYSFRLISSESVYLTIYLQDKWE